jgi:hypothetical protein
MWQPVPAVPLARASGGWDGPATPGTVFVSEEYDAQWALRGDPAEPEVAFGWATSFEAGGGPVQVRHEGGLPARIQVALLALLWLVALWATRKPVAR